VTTIAFRTALSLSKIVRWGGVGDVEKYCPESLWHLAQPLLPERPQLLEGRGRKRTDDRIALAAIAYVRQTGCDWEALPESFPISRATAYRRFAEWVDAGVMRALQEMAGQPGRAA
jgi:transposase